VLPSWRINFTINEAHKSRPIHLRFIIRVAVNIFYFDFAVDDMDRKFLRCSFPWSTVCILYSLQSKVIRTGSVLETTTFSSQSATILVASLLLYVVFFDLNKFFIVFVCFHDCQFLFFMYVLVFILLFLPLLCH